MIHETLTAGEVLAPVLSGLAVILLYHYIGREYLGGAENAFWNILRRLVLGLGDDYVRENTPFALTNDAHEDEYVGTVDMGSTAFALKLEEAGYVQCIASGLKARHDPSGPNGNQYESGSMAYRESKSDLLPDALAFHQTHVFWFENEDGTLDVYAHHEYSSLNPVVAYKHYRSVGQDAEKGKKIVRADLQKVDVEIA